MEKSYIKEAIEKIEELVLNANEAKVIVAKNGVEYYKDSNGFLQAIDIHAPELSRKHLELDSLEGLVANIKADLMNGGVDKPNVPIRLVVDAQKVTAYSSLNNHKVREKLYVATPLVPSIPFDSWISVEAAIITLQTCFLDDKYGNRREVMEQISSLKLANEIKLEDDGLTTKTTVEKGVTTKTISIQPIFTLKPQRTFYEVEQPEYDFLLRINQDASIKLIDAAGGSWKHLCRRSIIDYLSAIFKNEIKENLIILG